MIWLFRSNEVFWGNKPKVNEYFLFDVNDINFDITKYDISLYFPIADYFILSDSNDDEIYLLKYNVSNVNPIRYKLDPLVGISSEYYSMIKSFYNTELRDTKIKELGL
jgi:hypothetical protein